MAQNPANNDDNEIDLELWRRRAPRMAYWLGLEPTHPVIEAMRMDRNNNGPPAPPAAPPFVYPPYPRHGHDYPYQAAPPYAGGPPAPYDRIAPPFAPYGLPALPQQYNLPAQGALAAEDAGAVNNQRGQAPTHINVSIPLNTNVVGAIITCTPLRLPVDLSFNDFFSRICANMDLDPPAADLGYKFVGDRKRDAPFRLSCEEEYQAAISQTTNKMRNARTREVVLEIYNLKPAKQAGVTRGIKRTRSPLSGPADAQDPETTVNFGPILRKLKKHLACALHNGRYCYVEPIKRRHHFQDLYQLTFWAKSILFKEADYENPPSSKEYDYVSKRQRRQNPSASGTQPPAIHLHLPQFDSVTRGSSSNFKDITHSENSSAISSSTHSVCRSISASPITKFEDASIIDLTNDHDIVYPDISSVLNELNFPSMDRVAGNLRAYGVNDVGAVGLLDRDFFHDIGMPPEVVDAFLFACAEQVNGREVKAGPSVSDKENRGNL